MKRFIMILSLVFASLSVANAAYAQATQVDALIKKLVDKGILDKAEARELKAEIAGDEKAVREDTKNQILPEWVQKVKLKGDLRLRQQYERRKNDSESRGRSRIRYRLGIGTDVTKNVTIAAGLATGPGSLITGQNAIGNDPRSTNQTLENSFEHPDIRLDYAYGEWKAVDQPNDALKIVGGKFLKDAYLWQPSDMLWDTDINPTGVATNYVRKLSDTWEAFGNLGYLIVDEANRTDNNDDPFIQYAQAGLAYKGTMFDAKAAGVRYGFNNTKGKCPEWTAGTNSGVSTASGGGCSGALVHDYDSNGASAEFGAKKPFGGLPFGIDGRIAMFGDLIYNPGPEAENVGWAFGGKFGTEALKAPTDWQVKYTKVMLERDAFPDYLPDSDRYGGGTNTEGHEVEFTYVWKENITLGLDYYKAEKIIGAENQEQLLQGDIVFKF